MWLSGVGMPSCIRQRQAHALDYSFILTCAVCTDWHWHEAGAKRTSTCSKPCKASRSGFDAERTCKRLRKGVHHFVHQDWVICRQSRPHRFFAAIRTIGGLVVQGWRRRFLAQGGPRTQGPDPFFSRRCSRCSRCSTWNQRKSEVAESLD